MTPRNSVKPLAFPQTTVYTACSPRTSDLFLSPHCKQQQTQQMSPPGSSKGVKPPGKPADPRTRLLSEYTQDADNGTFSSRPTSSGGSVSSGLNWFKRATTTATLAEGAGVKHPWLMYLSYYIPCIGWVGHYQWSFLIGDVAAGSMFLLSSTVLKSHVDKLQLRLQASTFPWRSPSPQTWLTCNPSTACTPLQYNP